MLEISIEEIPSVIELSGSQSDGESLVKLYADHVHLYDIEHGGLPSVEKVMEILHSRKT